ncbi:MAG: hypothetical protein ACD_11C00021G0002 [uncultured bacterium]|nr:MAG: hypothetical protein ACD_11C00021G0002 [uncultured bacterium]HBR71351.1 hypothetical protein [Candidatus Moranbacteria bacterium]
MDILENKENNGNDFDKTTKNINKGNLIKSKKIILAVIGMVMLASFFGAVFGFMAGSVSKNLDGNFFAENNNENKTGSKVDVRSIIVEDSAVIDVVKNTSPAVVSIAITKDVSKMRTFDFFGFDFFSEEGLEGQAKQQVGSGSGFFLSSDGLIATNKHVVEDVSADYTVIINDGKEYPAKILAKDPLQDIAIIKIEGNNFSVLSVGNSDSVQIGQTVIAIGNSLGEFSNTVSRGIISGLGRTVIAGSEFSAQSERLSNIIQTDAAINPGNSGGPLININGEVVGMNVAMAKDAQNIGFALPINQVQKVFLQVKETGKISVPFLGVRYIPINEEMQKINNLPYSYGVLVQRGEKVTDLAVIPGSPADKANIQENDIILEIDGKKIDEENQLGDLIGKSNVGDTITLKIWHKGEEKTAKVALEERK